MIHKTDDLRIAELRPLIPPAILMEELPIGEKSRSGLNAWNMLA